MHRKVSLAVSALLLLLMVFQPIALSQEKKPQFEWKVQNTFALNTWDYAHGEKVLKRIEELSGGLIKTQMFPPGAIVPAFEVLDAVEKGVLQGAFAWDGYFVGKNTAFTLFASATGGPFGMDNLDFFGWMFFGGGYDLYRQLMADVGYKNVVPFMVKGELAEPLGWFRKEIKSVEDLRGLKMRVAGLAADVFRELGVSVVTVPAGEILPLLEKGVIDATEYSDPHSDMLLGLPDVLKYYHLPGIHQPSGFTNFYLNRKEWEKLPEELRKIIQAVCDEMTLKNTIEEWIWGQKALEKIEKELGVKVIRTPEEILIAFLKAWDKVAARECEKNPWFKKIYESQREWASKYVPFRRRVYPDYRIAADYYWGEKK